MGDMGPLIGEGVLELSRREPLYGGLERFDWNLYFGECAGHDPFAELALEPRRLHDPDEDPSRQHRPDVRVFQQRDESGFQRVDEDFLHGDVSRLPNLQTNRKCPCRLVRLGCRVRYYF